MNLKELLVDSSRAVVDITTKTVLSDPDTYYLPMVELAFSHTRKFSERAARILNFVNRYNRELINPYLKRIIHELDEMNSSKRMNFLALLLDHTYLHDDEELGILVDHCFKWLGSDKSTPGVKIYSLEILCEIARHIPELKNELILIIEDQLPKNTIAFKTRGLKALARLK